jgi:hypothetical protein
VVKCLVLKSVKFSANHIHGAFVEAVYELTVLWKTNPRLEMYRRDVANLTGRASRRGIRRLKVKRKKARRA